jgi:hypothetical protein
LKGTLEHRWSVGHNYLAGITAGDWWKLLHDNRFRISPAYAHRAAFITVLSLFNSWHRRIEQNRFNDQIEATEITRAPLFILGHWRSGTTHLQNLLAQDNDLFAYANTYQVINPHTFLTTEEINTRRFSWMLPSKRPMDNMALSFQSPQEDEFAPLLTCLLSPYLGTSFPEREEFYSRYLTFAEASPDEIARWKSAFTWFLKKLTFKYDRALLLKSPPHTARIRILLELFPDARFIHIHRHPEQVFQSFRHFYDTAMWHTYLQRPDREVIDGEIIARYRSLYGAFLADRDLIPTGNFHELSFDQLESDPLGSVKHIYQTLSLPGIDRALPKIASYVATLETYEKNRLTPLDEFTRQRLRDAWSPVYTRWGYEIR